MKAPKGWGIVGGLGQLRLACEVNLMGYRLTKLAEGKFSLATWIEGERYWHFLGEFDSPESARTRVDAIEDFSGCNE